MDHHDRLLSGRVAARFPVAARHRAAAALSAAMSQVLTVASATADASGDITPLEEAMDAWRLLRALQVELKDLAGG